MCSNIQRVWNSRLVGWMMHIGLLEYTLFTNVLDYNKQNSISAWQKLIRRVFLFLANFLDVTHMHIKCGTSFSIIYWQTDRKLTALIGLMPLGHQNFFLKLVYLMHFFTNEMHSLCTAKNLHVSTKNEIFQNFSVFVWEQ